MDGERVITSQEALDLTKQPKRIAVLGGGVVGTEFACFFAAVGSQVTLVEMLPRLVPGEDDDIAAVIEQARQTRALLGPRDPYKLYLPALPSDIS